MTFTFTGISLLTLGLIFILIFFGGMAAGLYGFNKIFKNVIHNLMDELGDWTDHLTAKYQAILFEDLQGFKQNILKEFTRAQRQEQTLSGYYHGSEEQDEEHEQDDEDDSNNNNDRNGGNGWEH